MNEPKEQEYWIFLAYTSESNYPLKPYCTKVFDDHQIMKAFSAKHSSEEKSRHPQYCSTYIKTDSL